MPRRNRTIAVALVVGGLIRKRRELVKRAAHRPCPEIEAELRAIDVTIDLFGPIIDLKPTGGGPPIELVLLRQLAAAPKGLSGRTLVLALMRELGLPNDDLRQVRRVALGVSAALERLADDGEAHAFYSKDQPPTWMISDQGRSRLESAP